MQPLLSIYIPTFNHENYIKKAIESVLMQKTDYEFEVLIGEDCSTDRTRKILQKMQSTLPDNFKIFYRDHNMYNEMIDNASDLRSRCKGKYIIALEGDDYWIDEYKLQKQIMFLESHPEYYAVCHNCVIVDEYSCEKKESYPECKDTTYSIQHYCSDIMPGQLTTFMYRNYLIDKYMNSSFIQARTPEPGDRKLYYSFAINNLPIYCMQDRMTAYRHVTNKGSSFSANWTFDFDKEIDWFNVLLNYSYDVNTKEAIKYGEYLYFRNLFQGYRYGCINTYEMLSYLKKLRHPYNTIFFYIHCQINKRLFRKNIYVS